MDVIRMQATSALGTYIVTVETNEIYRNIKRVSWDGPAPISIKDLCRHFQNTGWWQKLSAVKANIKNEMQKHGKFIGEF